MPRLLNRLVNSLKGVGRMGRSFLGITTRSTIFPIGQAHLRRVLEEYAEHYHHERNHQGLDNRMIDGNAKPEPVPIKRVRCRERVGGLLRSYHRAA